MVVWQAYFVTFVLSVSSLLVPVLDAAIITNTQGVTNAARNSDPYNDFAAITYIDPSILLNLPFGTPPSMLDDTPGPSLSPAEFNYELPLKDYLTGQHPQNDPLELAGAFEGDIILATPAELQQMTQPSEETMVINSRNAVIKPDRVWPLKEIPYVISSGYNQLERGTIAVAMRNFHLKTCIKFVPRTTQRDYIHIYKGEGCSSSVGRIGGHQAVSLGDGCIYVGIVMHELMHAAGFWHEQSRFDRDNYITIHWSNIKHGMEYNFQKYDWKTISHLDIKYDLASIMHYGSKSFANNPSRPTIVAKNRAEIGQRRGFSMMDVEKLRKLYKCHETTYSKVTTARPSTKPTTGYETLNQCRDTYDELKCKAWSSTGECNDNPDWMVPNCKKSCKKCQDKCSNLNPNCDYWAKKTQCTENTAYMHLYCKKSCGLCHAPGDVSMKCIDQNQYCESWAASGNCHTKTDYMLTFCKKSCTECDKTDELFTNLV